jgi:sialidase-1
MTILIRQVSQRFLLPLLALLLTLQAASPPAVSPPPRALSAGNAAEGFFPGMNHRFTIANYWDYGSFQPQQCVELPGSLFRARAYGLQCREAFLISGQDKWSVGPQLYSLKKEPLYAAWRVRVPAGLLPSGKYSYVHPGRLPWQIWLQRGSSGKPQWHITLMQSGKESERAITTPIPPEGWYEVRLTLKPRALELEINRRQSVRFTHDPYPRDFRMHFGSAQSDPKGGSVVSDFRYIFFDRFPYPYSLEDALPQGPEDIHPEDRAILRTVNPASPSSPRHSEGDVISLEDGRLLLIWSDYFKGEGWDHSAARLSAKTSNDGGRNWSEPWTVVNYEPQGSGGNVMSVSLLRARGGDLLMAYHDQTPRMKAKGMVLRRSTDEGKTWSGREPITPNNGNRHVANNACFRMLRRGRIVLSCREYVGGIRWPYALYSDDDGHSWKAGQHVPPPDLTKEQVRAQNVNEPSIAELPDGGLIMMMRSVAGGHFLSYSSDGGESWTKPYLSPLRGVVSPPCIATIPSTGDLLAVWSYGMTERSPLNTAVSRDAGKTWSPVKLLERSENFGYGYTSVTFLGDRVILTTMQYPLFSSLERFQAVPGYTDLLFLSLPIEWFYRMPQE